MKSRLLPALWLYLAFSSGALAAPECAAVPATKVELRPVSVDRIDQETASPDDIARLGMTGNGPAPHPLMAVRYVIDTNVAVVHRIVKTADGGFCDAPEAVVFRFGVIRRGVVLVPQAAADPCVRDALLAHEAEHNRIVREAIGAFLHEHQAELGQRLAHLKQQRARDANAAKKAMELGLMDAITRLFERFKQNDVGRVRNLVDSPARLHDLAISCDGRIAELERSVKRDGKDL